MKIVKVISTRINSITSRLVKVLRMGNADVQEVLQSSPYGIDSNPIKDMRALYSETGVKGENVIIGYINKNQLADVGETRIFSTDSDGNIQTYIHLLNDGNMDIGGNTDYMVRYSELETAFNAFKSDFNSFVSTYNSHIHITTATVGATPTPGVLTPTPSTGTPTTADISGAKIDEIRTI